MKNLAATILISLTALTSAKAVNDYSGKATLTNNVDSVSYALGVLNGSAITSQLSQSLPFNITDSTALAKLLVKYDLNSNFVTHFSNIFEGLNSEAFKYGFYHQSVLGNPQISLNDAENTCDKRFNSIKSRKEAEHAASLTKNLEEGKAFLADNAKKSGVVSLESGLQYKVITMGNGQKPTPSNRVKVHYTGKLLNGKVFDSSIERGEPITLSLNNVIKGWTEVLQLMPTGSKWIVYIPSDLAYGERGGGDDIPGNATLIFEIELISIVD